MRRCIVCNAPGGLDGWCGECCLPNVVAETDPALDAPDAPSARIVPLIGAGAAGLARIVLPSPRSKLARLLGGAPRGSTILVHGRPGAGKTSDAVEFASELAAAEDGRALLLSGEMPLPIAELVIGRTAGPELARVDVAACLGGPVPAFDPRPFVAVVYDSANRLGQDPVKITTRAIEHARAHGLVALVIAHETTEHGVKGGTDLAHDVDAHVEVLSRTAARIVKARIDTLAMDVNARRGARSKRCGAPPRRRSRAARPQG